MSMDAQTIIAGAFAGGIVVSSLLSGYSITPSKGSWRFSQ